MSELLIYRRQFYSGSVQFDPGWSGGDKRLKYLNGSSLMRILVFRANYARSRENKLRPDNVDGYVKTVAHGRLRE